MASREVAIKNDGEQKANSCAICKDLNDTDPGIILSEQTAMYSTSLASVATVTL
jgi:hypothetical protein